MPLRPGRRAVDADTPRPLQCRPVPPVRGLGLRRQGVPVCRAAGHLPKEPSTVFYIGSNAPDDLTAVRRHPLTALPRLPIAGEYIHRTAFDIGESTARTPSCSSTALARPACLRPLHSRAGVDGFFERPGDARLCGPRHPGRHAPAAQPPAPARAPVARPVRNTTCWCAYRTTRWKPRAPS